MLRHALTALSIGLFAAAGAHAQEASRPRLTLDGSRLQPGRWVYTYYLLPPSAARFDIGVSPSLLPAAEAGSRPDVLVYLEPYIGPYGLPARGDSSSRSRRDTVGRQQMAYVHDSTARALGPSEFVLADTLYGGTPSWRLTVEGTRGGIRFADSLWVQRANLRPQHWGASIGLARLAAEFTRDSIFAGLSSPTGRRSLEAAAPGDLLVNEAMTDLALRLLPLVAGRAESLSVLVADIGAIATPAARLMVEGEERVVVPAGVFDSWIVSLETERGRALYWVAKDPRLVVKSEQVLPHMGGAVLRRELLRN